MEVAEGHAALQNRDCCPNSGVSADPDAKSRRNYITALPRTLVALTIGLLLSC